MPKRRFERGKSYRLGGKPTRGGTDDLERSVADKLTRVTVPPELDDPEKRARWRLEVNEHKRGPYLVELNVQYISGLPGAAKAFLDLFEATCCKVAREDGLPEPPKPVAIGKSYYRCDLRVREWRALVAGDERSAGSLAELNEDEARYRSIYRLWPDFPVEGQISRSVATVKADAAQRSFEATGENITWAVIDSGIQADHPHFGSVDSDHVVLHRGVRDLHRCFVPVRASRGAAPAYLDDPDANPSIENRDIVVAAHRRWALSDDYGHGTHVAGIIAGGAPEGSQVVVLEREDSMNAELPEDETRARIRVTKERRADPKEVRRFRGVAPACHLVSLRVLDENGFGRSSDVIRALDYVREKLNDNPKLLRVHGVNLSVGYEFDAELFACGQSPLCSEVNRLVQSGVVVVTAAGNTGFGAVNADARPTKVGLSNTINDPGNAEFAITVGATHREAPHTYGVSYFSSKGPTGDGRLKPDLVAPGERIISCAAGKKLAKARESRRQPSSVAAERTPTEQSNAEESGPIYYVEDSGTSMAAPHVSGAIAAFLSIRREFIGRPLEVKRIFLDSAIDLGRERYFEGHGLLDLMRAIQSV